MAEREDRRLRAAQLQQAFTVSEDDALAGDATADVVAALEHGWVVILDREHQPTAALPPVPPDSPILVALRRGELSLDDLISQLPGIVVADVETSFGAVLDQVEEAGLEPTVAVVVVEFGEIRGVSTPPELNSQLFRIRYGSTTLPGPVKIPIVLRRCRFHQINTQCGFTQRFNSRPPTMPPCPNPLHLQPHNFVW